ncbi:MAG: hypothetical protein QOD60_2011 [Solirubrobacterales bacterium]|nr:hypothetical protein [Solirubrobacterales bacterium]
MTTGRRLNVPLALAGAGAVVVLLPFLGDILQLVGVIAIVIGAVFTAPPPSDRRGPELAGVPWWQLLAAGAVISVIALPLSLLLATIGGLLAGVGGALVLIGVVFGYPAG